MDIISLDGTGSTDSAGGSNLAYEWKLNRWPPNSLSAIQSADQCKATFELDQKTKPNTPYEFQLKVTDRCNSKFATCIFTVHTYPIIGTYILITWDKASDVDLHLLWASCPDGGACSFNATPYDCNNNNMNPDWGEPDNTDDNPQYASDTIGPDPESIKFEAPADGTYKVGLHYKDDKGLGATEVTVEVYCNMYLEKSRKITLTGTGDFREAFQIVWPGCSVSEL